MTTIYARVALAAISVPTMCMFLPGKMSAQTQTSRDWSVICDGASGSDCIAAPAAFNSESAQIYVVDDGTGPVMVVRTKLGVLLGEGVLLSVDGETIGRLGFQICEENGCVAPLRLRGAPLRAMQRGTELNITLVDRGTGEQNSEVSLLGFSFILRALAAN